MQHSTDRVVSVDAYRGLVLLLLLPDIHGGFSFYEMARRFPHDPFWAALAAQFTHVQWSGLSTWDLVMPAFVFLVGVAMPLSVAARRQRGETDTQILGHFLLRSAALFLLALMLRLPLRTHFDELAPFMLLAAGLPVAAWIARALRVSAPPLKHRIDLAWWSVILIAAAIWIAFKLEDLGNYEFVHILAQLALASAFAFLLVGRGRRVQIASALGILALYWLLFALYPLPGPGFDPLKVGVLPSDQVYAGFFAHWNKNTNAAAAFDAWFLNALPRAEPFLFNPRGLQTLDFVPTIATMIFGVMAGELLRSDFTGRRIRNILLAAGAVAVVAGLAAGQWLCPIVKSIWTPSWTLLSSGLTTIFLAVFYQLCDVRRSKSWAFPLVVFGTNSILLYVLASNYRWWFLSIPGKLSGVDLFTGPAAPVWESAVFALMLWVIAFVLYRLKIFVKL